MKKMQEKNKDKEEDKEEEKETLPGKFNYLHGDSGTGGTIVRCTHYAHFECLSNYLAANESSMSKRDLRKIIGLSLDNYQCPLCKHLANVLFPCYTDLNNGNQGLLQFYTDLISKIMSA